ncbi:MAG TPA: indole-3-glycerol phosphate synthase TrpC [Bacillota bacterium]|nr:indole-3-glycerol phosphate synthase TrpC [Bacillota bacterium]
MFLDEILQYKKNEIAAQKAGYSLRMLERELYRCPPVRPFARSLRGESIRLIAEVKKASPSKGLLCPNFNPVALAKSYESGGAAAISVLTDEKFFQGSLKYLKQVKETTVRTPVLRKDFILDPYQLVEARLQGADAVLLIVAALSKQDFHFLLREAVSFELASLVEVHNQSELEIALEAGASIIGINNRDLKTFEVTLGTTYQLLETIPTLNRCDITIVSESGIKNRRDIQELAAAGVNAVLIGESIVTAKDPGQQIRDLLGASE